MALKLKRKIKVEYFDDTNSRFDEWQTLGEFDAPEEVDVAFEKIGGRGTFLKKREVRETTTIILDSTRSTDKKVFDKIFKSLSPDETVIFLEVIDHQFSN